MNDYALTPTAQADLQKILASLVADHPEAANEVEIDIFEACQLLAKHPQMGIERPRWTDLPVHFWLVSRFYAIVFYPASEPLQILRILQVLHPSPEVV